MGISVLFSEPNAEVCVLCVDSLRRKGYSVESYCNPAEALARAVDKHSQFYAAVVDISPFQIHDNRKASRDLIDALHARNPRIYVVSISTDPRKTADSDFHIDKPYHSGELTHVLDQRIHACFQDTMADIQQLWDRDFKHCITPRGNMSFRETMRFVRTAYNEGRYWDAGTKARAVGDDASAKSDHCERTGPEPTAGWSYFDMFKLWYAVEDLIWEKERALARKSALPTRHEMMQLFQSGEGVSLTGDEVAGKLEGVASGPVRMLLQKLVREDFLRKHQGSFLLNSPAKE